jgi:LemA protein
MGGGILIGIVVVVALMAFGGYNHLVTLRNRVQSAWSPIDVQLKRRYDLIPDLVETAGGSMKHEREVLESVTMARQQATDARGIPEQAEAENQLSQTLRSLFAVAEAYPDLKANPNMLALQEELTTRENEIAFARQYYNDQVMALNINIRQFPWNLIAGPAGFHPAEYFVMDEPAQREAPPVAFSA